MTGGDKKIATDGSIPMLARMLVGLLTHARRHEAVALLFMMLVGMGLETLGIGLVIPAIALMSQGNLAATYPAFIAWISQFGNPSQEHLIAAGMFALVLVYVFKTLFLGFLAWRQARFVYGVQSELSQELFSVYLAQPYIFHLQRNSAHLIRNVIGQVSDFAVVIQQGLLLITEILVMSGILVLLLAIEPLGALLVALVLGAASWAFHGVTRNYLLQWGAARQLHEGQRIQHLQQGLGGAKEIKLLGRESEFLSQYAIHNMGSARIGQRQTTLQALPRLWLELLAITGLAVLVVFLIGQDKPAASILPTVGLFAAAAFRLAPSANRILGAIQNLRFALPAIQNLQGELNLRDSAEKNPDSHPFPLRDALVVRNVTFSYPTANRESLQDINIEIACGASVGIIGGSGSGKSTLADILLGLLKPEHGVVMVDSMDIRTNLRGWQDQIGYVPQHVFLTDDTVRRNVALGLSDQQIDEEAVWRAIRAAQLEELVATMPSGLDTRVGERGISLSGGQRQRIGIARALYHDPRVLILDEATSSLDVDTERKIMAAVGALKGKKTTIVIAHRLRTVEECDRIYKLGEGRVVDEGVAAQVLARA